MTSMPQQFRKYLDWRGWVIGLYLAVGPAAFSKLIDYLGTNGLDAAGAHGVGISWRQALAGLGCSIVLNAALYMRAKPLPDVVERPVTAPPMPIPRDPPTSA